MNQLLLKTVLFATILLLIGAGAALADDEPARQGEDLEYTTTDSGLQYAVIRKGAGGERPSGADMVTVKFTIKTSDGELIQTSEGQTRPAQFRVNRVLPGWGEGISLMTVGAKYRLILPPEVGYGERGFPPKITADTVLIIDVELVEFEKGPALPVFRPGNPEKQVKLKNGLIYEPIRAGDGMRPEAGEVVQARFAIWNEEGDLVDCSELRRGTMRFPVGRIGLQIYNVALPLLREGARYRFIVPSELAYGERGAGLRVPPNATTIWEIELEKVLRAKPVPAFVMPAEEKLVTTESGLRYEMVREGKGPSPRPEQKAFINYAGWSVDGKCFDESFSDGEEKMCLVDRQIPGWVETLQLMKPGGICRIVIPAKMAIGRMGPLPTVPKDAEFLVYHIELVRVEDRTPKAQPRKVRAKGGFPTGKGKPQGDIPDEWK